MGSTQPFTRQSATSPTKAALVLPAPREAAISSHTASAQRRDAAAGRTREARSGADAVIAFESVPRADVINYGIAKPRGDAGPVFALSDVVEKPSVVEAPSTLAVAARYVFSPRIFALLEKTPPGKGGEIQLTDAIRLLIQQGGKVLGMRLSAKERRFDIGNFESYFKAFIEFALKDPRYGTELREYVRQLIV